MKIEFAYKKIPEVKESTSGISLGTTLLSTSLLRHESECFEFGRRKLGEACGFRID